MKTIFKRTSTHLLIATLAAGMGVHLSSHAQSAPADTSSVVITGQITANTCAVNVSDVGSPSSGTGSKSLFLGNIAGTAAAAGTTGPSLFGNPVTTMFTLGNATTPSTACTFSSGTNWDLALNLTTDKISTITSSLGTNRVLVVMRASTTSPTNNSPAAAAPNALTLKPNIGLTGNYVSGSNTPGSINTWKNLSATLVNGNGGQVSAGRYVQTIQLLAVYN